MVLLVFSAGPVLAAGDPLVVPNNVFGIHILDENDLEDAVKLVNSNGGDWGYVTIVIQESDKNSLKWQRTFNRMKELHVIPIVRIASTPERGLWKKLSVYDIDPWVAFLSGLSWPTQNRYIVVGNEPNHAKEWGGEVNPKEYATYLKTISIKLKEASPDFFVLPAGLDASAPNLLGYMDEGRFLALMQEAEPDVFDYIDGWTSHSYPNPGFLGSEKATGRGSVTTFEWELNYLITLGITKSLPVFITETGWIHTQRKQDIQKVGERLTYAYQNVWNHPSVVAVTPFVLNYQSKPFEGFSWKDKEGGYYPFYTDIQNLSKTKGEPILPPEPKKEIKEYQPTYFGLAQALYNINTDQKMQNLSFFGKI